MKKIYILSLLLTFSFSNNAQVVISQVYGGGGNTGATYTNDFIELFNSGTTAQNLNGWSVQYAAFGGPSGGANPNWISTNLPNFNLLPGQYFLIQQAAGANTIAALPTPDLIASGSNTFNSDGTAGPANGIAMGGTNGKVILVNTTTQQTATNPTGTQIVDKLGYGTATGFEGTVLGALSNSTSASRNSAGCTDTNNNANDFTVGAVVARNSASPLNVCPPLSLKENNISGLSIYPNPVTGKTFTVSTANNSDINVTIFDVIGKQVLNTKVINNTVNVANLNAGVYIVKITEEGKTATRKLVIQ